MDDHDGGGDAVDVRRDRALEQRRRGMPIAAVAALLAVSTATVRRDLAARGVPRWDTVERGGRGLAYLVEPPRQELFQRIWFFMRHANRHVSPRRVAAWIRRRYGLLIQVRLVAEAMAALGFVRDPPRRIRRRMYFNARGKNYIWSLDHACKMAAYGLAVIVAVDAYTRYPVHWQVGFDVR